MTWEERWHPLREEWVIVAVHRESRPWQGEAVETGSRRIPPYVEDCYLCPGNTRISGERNPDYSGVYVFDNDHPCVASHAPASPAVPEGIYRSRRADGIARVVCYTPRHNLTLAELSLPEVENLLAALREQYIELAERPEVDHVLIFENKGEVVGVSNPHPHCQIYATNFVFKTIELEAQIASEYFRREGRVLFQDIIASELADGRRVLVREEQAISFVPYFSRYPYEVFVAPTAPHGSLADLNHTELKAFAAVLKDAAVRYDNLWKMSFPYVMVLHQKPTDGGDYTGFHFHIEFFPPLRKPALRKHLAGPEIGGGNFINAGSPEKKAAELRAVSDTHYKKAHTHA